MTKKEKLLKYLLGVSLASSITITGTSCSSVSVKTDDNRRKLAGEVSVDANETIFDIYSYSLSAGDDKLYITFYGHYDTGFGGFPDYKYRNHQDYAVKYEISREDYLAVHEFTGDGYTKVNNLTNEMVDKLVEIAVNYDSIATEILNPDEEQCFEQ